MEGSSRCLKVLKVPKQVIGAKLILKKLLLQMDKYVKDNKSQHLFDFLSLLTTKEVFEEVQLGFHVVGHTHEDIDGKFGYLSKKLKLQNNYVLVDLMKTFMVSRQWPVIPQLIQEIPYFKSWVQGYLKNGPEISIGHIDMHLFHFFVDSSWWLVMQYKVFPIDSIWNPKDGPTILL